MAGLIGLALTIGFLVAAVLNNIYIGFPLLLGYAYFTAFSLIKGRSIAQIYAVSKEGAKKAFIIIPVLLLIGCVVASWMASGTVGALVYYSLSLISPYLFILFAFLLPSLISMLLGTSFGTVGTIGVILMVLARGGGVDPYITAGAIISGSFVGDRCSPMASLMYLLSSVTETDVQANIKMLVKTTLLPFALAAALFLLVSLSHPLLAGQSTLRQDISDNFRIGFLSFLPAIIIITLAALKLNVKISLLASAVCAALLAVYTQGI
ncbi:MAG: Na+/H+ antiporter NhaC family protein, partial [Clostridiales bacterium]|nr:Na+/H+ antiporter NhaC family protein [Clostridiales bacterium]